MKQDIKPDYTTERARQSEGFAFIIGVDEVGRGPWAGPVVAAAVILNANALPLGATDSKKLSAKKRAELTTQIEASAKTSIAEASVEEIDALNIRNATFLAMFRAVEGLKLTAEEMRKAHIYIDGNAIPPALITAGWNTECVIKGDSKVMSIAAASIIAKEYRDNMMANLAKKQPHYGWERNAGYGTKAHQEGLKVAGLTVHHRRSFKPIQALL